MAARRLLIVMLILLGLSTLAAALVPQHALRGGTTTGTTTQPTQSTTTAAPAPGRSLRARIKIGGKTIPVVAGPVCLNGKCGEPIHVGDQLSLEVFARKQTELEIRSFGLIGVASKTAPALFQLLFTQPTNIGIVSTSTGEPAAKIEVLSAKAAAKAMKPKSRARAGSGRP